jgi:pentatricopeptide repeat protein
MSFPHFRYQSNDGNDDMDVSVSVEARQNERHSRRAQSIPYMENYKQNLRSNSLNRSRRNVKEKSSLSRTVKSPDTVEEELSNALDALKSAVSQHISFQRNQGTHSDARQTDAVQLLLFPTIRECNAAIAAFGDAADLLRALKLFGKMRKSVTLHRSLQQQVEMNSQQHIGGMLSPVGTLLPPIPAPTIVTYSTLMSRFVKANKPIVALRLWNLMIHSTYPQRHEQLEPIVIDVKAANILMNCYAKMADVSAAQQLLRDMRASDASITIDQNSSSTPNHILHKRRSRHPVQLPKPNTITYNTFLSACHKAGDLDAAVKAVSDMQADHLATDTLTYTTLIATVARRRSQVAGRYDPSPAFQFLQDMRHYNVTPNGMTYSALIDACGRCRRSDLALQGLRMMLRQKQEDLNGLACQERNDVTDGKNYTLPGEVGAWTAAINACGKAGRLDTAVRLFFAMSNFGVQPNTVTCGSLTDSLLRAGRTAETLDVLRYMKRAGIAPSEVMYTSLMSRAEKLVEIERKSPDWSREKQDVPLHPPLRETPLYNEDGHSKAIEVYTELIDSLLKTNRKTSNLKTGRSPAQDSKSHQLLKVFLVFQEMKTAGVKIDAPCYNALLRACAQAGDVQRAQEVIRTMQRDEVDPNDTSWRLLLRSALSSDAYNDNPENQGSRVQMAEDIWKQGLSYRKNRSIRIDEPLATSKWIPSVDTFVSFISVYLTEADVLLSKRDQRSRRQQYLSRIVQHYESILLCRNDDSMGMDRIDVNRLLESQRAMLAILQAIVTLDEELSYQFKAMDESIVSKIELNQRRRSIRNMATSILQLPCFNSEQAQSNSTSFATIHSLKLGPSARQALRTARLWTVQFS